MLIPLLLRHPCGIVSDAILELEGHNLPLYPCMHQRAQMKELIGDVGTCKFDLSWER